MAIGIRESFTKDVIEEYDADITEEEELELNALVSELTRGAQGEFIPNELAVLAFVAGRAYEASAREELPAGFTVTLRREVLEHFIEFLVDGRQSE